MKTDNRQQVLVEPVVDGLGVEVFSVDVEAQIVEIEVLVDGFLQDQPVLFYGLDLGLDSEVLEVEAEWRQVQGIRPFF